MDSEKQILESYGYGWKEFQTDRPIQKRKFYTPNGREMVLPADSYSLNHYLKKGFTLTPPPAGQSEQAVDEPPTEAVEAQLVEVGMEQVQPKKTRRKKRKYRRKIKQEV